MKNYMIMLNRIKHDQLSKSTFNEFKRENPIQNLFFKLSFFLCLHILIITNLIFEKVQNCFEKKVHYVNILEIKVISICLFTEYYMSCQKRTLFFYV